MVGKAVALTGWVTIPSGGDLRRVFAALPGATDAGAYAGFEKTIAENLPRCR